MLVKTHTETVLAPFVIKKPCNLKNIRASQRVKSKFLAIYKSIFLKKSLSIFVDLLVPIIKSAHYESALLAEHKNQLFGKKHMKIIKMISPINFDEVSHATSNPLLVCSSLSSNCPKS